MSDPRAAALKKKIDAWVKGKCYSLEWQDHAKADLAVEGLSNLFRYQYDQTEFTTLEDLIIRAGACYDVEFHPSRLTLIYFIPSVPISTSWCVKHDGRYMDFFDKKVLEISRDAGIIGREGKVIEVRMRPVKLDETSKYWAYWDTKDRKYVFCHPGREILSMCTDGNFKREERENKGRVVNVMIEEV